MRYCCYHVTFVIQEEEEETKEKEEKTKTKEKKEKKIQFRGEVEKEIVEEERDKKR